MAFGKLKGILPGRPTVFPGQQPVNLLLFTAAVLIALWLIVAPSADARFPLLIGASVLFGILLVVPIGGADMPTVISLLNSYAGLSGAAMGLVLDNKALIVAGALDGASGLLLSVMMSRPSAMCSSVPSDRQRPPRPPGEVKRRTGRCAARAPTRPP
jgi:NAD(P) transhydrogenase subunit beta